MPIFATKLTLQWAKLGQEDNEWDGDQVCVYLLKMFEATENGTYTSEELRLKERLEIKENDASIKTKGSGRPAPDIWETSEREGERESRRREGRQTDKTRVPELRYCLMGYSTSTGGPADRRIGLGHEMIISSRPSVSVHLGCGKHQASLTSLGGGHSVGSFSKQEATTRSESGRELSIRRGGKPQRDGSPEGRTAGHSRALLPSADVDESLITWGRAKRASTEATKVIAPVS
jgi:hypothetical protein